MGFQELLDPVLTLFGFQRTDSINQRPARFYPGSCSVEQCFLHFCTFRNLARSDAVQHIGVAAENRSEEHTSELQSRENLVCRLLLEKKKVTSCRLSTRYNAQ